MHSHRRFLVPLVALAFLLAGGFGATAHAAKDKPPAGKIEIKGCQKKKPPVSFDHGAHVKLLGGAKSCADCHHNVKGNAATEHSCTSCHSKPQGTKPGTCADASPSKNPLHVTCIGCHKKELAAGKTKAATKCGQCHAK
ncbi:MAG: cytochrome c3 family protein [Proteobacteria bacterium]|nr:cytochrome c3 family protein [Pseudomonadota bacterium]